MVKSPYPPGNKRKRRRGGTGSEYAKEMSEKQKLKNWYHLRERQFGKYVGEILAKRSRKEDAGLMLIKKLESRLDNVVFRLGFALSRKQARQLVNHGHFLVNNKKINIPSYQTKKGDVITVSPAAKNRNYFKNIQPILKKQTRPSWLKFDIDKMEAEIIGQPSLIEAAPPVEILTIFEFYSK